MKNSEKGFKKKRVGIKDVARIAGVSPTTVSRVFNNTAPVNDDVRERVLAIAKQLGYRPNPHAKALLTGHSNVIGVLITEIDTAFFGTLFRGIEKVLGYFEYGLLIASGERNRALEMKVSKDFIDRRVDGIVMYPEALEDEDIKKLSAEGIPLIILGRVVPGIEDQCLAFDHEYGGYIATKKLIENGHRKIAHISGPLYTRDGRARFDGYKRALSEAGIPFNRDLVAEGDFNEDSGYLATKKLLSVGGFTAIFCANDNMAQGCIAALNEANMRVPEDISIIGYDDIPSAKYLIPPLATVRQPLMEMGEACAKLLLKNMGKASLSTTIPDLKIVERKSIRRI